MIVQYNFDANTAELLNTVTWEAGVGGATMEVVRPHDRTCECVAMTVKEGNHARKEIDFWWQGLGACYN